ncbi:MAG: CvpA family protein [Pirellulales bacterium]|nr:CvpA family protein [Pirellulales bacterium]
MTSPVHMYDLIMLAVLVASTVFGAWKGMAWQVASLASLLVSYLVARQFGGLFAPLFGVEEPWNYCIAMLLLYLATSLAIWSLFRLVARAIDRVKLKEFDRQTGALFGAAKGVLWCLLITFFAVTLSEPARQRVLQSHSGYYAAVLLHRAAPVLPPKVNEVLGHYIEDFQKRLNPETPVEELPGFELTPDEPDEPDEPLGGVPVSRSMVS